ncbi:hypothetical protein B0H19DRAFT_1321122 [Mycena capillaripes]|nr:hypothetical protein B0H19DRAFT_1321122 [Mycena capillaripes]
MKHPRGMNSARRRWINACVPELVGIQKPKQRVQDVTQWNGNNEQSLRSIISVRPYYPCTCGIHLLSRLGCTDHLSCGCSIAIVHQAKPSTAVLGVSQAVNAISAPVRMELASGPGAIINYGPPTLPSAEIAFCQWLDAPQNRPPTNKQALALKLPSITHARAFIHPTIKTRSFSDYASDFLLVCVILSRTDPRQRAARANYVSFQVENATCKAPPGTALCRRGARAIVRPCWLLYMTAWEDERGQGWLPRRNSTNAPWRTPAMAS